MKPFHESPSHAHPSPESTVEQGGEAMIRALQDAFRDWVKHADEKEQGEVVSMLERIGQMLEETTQGKKGARAMSALWNEMAHRFEIGLGSGTSGKRLLINTEKHATHSRDLIFPNADVAPYSKSAKSYADAFEELFGSMSKNIGTPERPYFVISLLQED
jgi:hypothetical protein